MIADEAGILAKHAKANGVTIELSPPMDYIESINLYTAGEYTACNNFANTSPSMESDTAI